MRQRIFYITGLEPASGPRVNKVLKALDLGIEGTFVNFQHRFTATLADDVTQDKLDKQAAALRLAYEQLGCVDVVVIEAEARAE